MIEDFTGQGILEDAYSYNRPAEIIANGLLNGLIRAGYTKEQAINLFYAKPLRWALDMALGEHLHEIGYQYGQIMAQEYTPDEFNYPLQPDQKIALMKLLEEVKKNSSKWIKTKDSVFANFYWQDGYGAFSVSFSHKDIIYNYINNQKQHHQKIKFIDEFYSLLKKHNVVFEIIDCDEYLIEYKSEFLNFIQTKIGTEYKTFPIVYVDGKLIGGCDDFLHLYTLKTPIYNK